MWGVTLIRLQLLCLMVATIMLVTTTWTKLDPGITFSQSSTIVVLRPFEALMYEASNSPQKPVLWNLGRRSVNRMFSRSRTHSRKLIGTTAGDTSERAVGKNKENGKVALQVSTSKVPGLRHSLKEKINLWKHEKRKKLLAAKRIIVKAAAMDVDPTLDAEVYHNVTAFFKSYELMEKVFRIYVYKEGRRPFVHSGPMTGIYASEGQFIAHMQKRNNRFVVGDPWRAQMFFMPYSIKFMETYLYEPETQSLRPITSYVSKYVQSIKSRHPFWNITNGTNHFFISCHDWGPKSAADHIELRSNAVKVVCNADTSSTEFSSQRDISLPEINIHYLVKPSYIGGPGPDDRPTLAFFAGQMHGPVRPTLIKYWQRDPDMKIYSVEANEMKKADYIQNMRSSKYCICAHGYEVNSPRIVESIYQDCVPVILADHIVLPFSDILNWEKFSVKILESDIPILKQLLTSIPDEKYRAMQRRLKNIRHHFLWNDNLEQKYDVFHMILHSLWWRLLEQVDDTTLIQ